MPYLIDSVTRLEKYPNVHISESGSWLESEEPEGNSDE